MPEHRSDVREYVSADAAQPISLSRFVHTVRAYRLPIVLGILAVAIAYAIFALATYLLAPAQRLTTQQFRLEFKGADRGEYPNGAKFSSAEIVSTPILLKVYEQNQLGRFTTFPAFSSSVFVLESNVELERLAADFGARLANPQLTAVDRDRIVSEFESKRASLKKNDYSINFLRKQDTAAVPETVVRKVLVDVLTAWAHFAAIEHRVLDIPVGILSPNVVNPTALEKADPIVAIHTLRSRINRALENIRELEKIPGADVARTGGDGRSLAEMRIALEDMMSFRLDPLISIAGMSGAVRDLDSTLRFVESQLRYNERRLQMLRDRADSVRQALAVYAMERPALFPEEEAKPASAAPGDRARGGGESVTPQLSDSFIDRLVELTTQATDAAYRQRLVDDFRNIAERIPAAEQVVAYDRAVLEELRSPRGDSAFSAAEVWQQIEATRADVRALIAEINALHRIVSRSLNPATQIFELTRPATTTIERSVDLRRLVLMGALVLLIAIPVAIVLALLHNRIREEEAEEIRNTDPSAAEQAAG